jgi:CHAT domain-containing protein/predicted negative regulator of RcsB-dependent stress response
VPGRRISATRFCATALALVFVYGCAGTEHPRFSRANAAVRQLIDSGRYAEAQAAAESLARSYEQQAPGAASAETAALAIDLLIEARWKNGDISGDTLQRAERAMQTNRRSADSFLVGERLRNLGYVLLLEGRTAEAVTRFEESLRASEQQRGSQADVALSLEALANGLVELARYDDAERALARALGIREAASNGSQTEVARTLELVALVDVRRGRYSHARPPLLRALTIRRHQAEHGDGTKAFALWGDLLWLEGKAVAARDAYQQCLTIGQKVLRSSHPDVAHCTRRLGNTLARVGDLGAALNAFERAASMAEQSLGSSHPAFAGYLNDLGNAHRLLMDLRKARELYERALAVRERLLGSMHQDVATIVFNLAMVSRSLGDVVEAERQYRRAANIWRTRLGPDHPYVAMVMSSLARVLLDHGREDDAIALHREVLAMRERSLGAQHPDTAETLVDLAASLLARGQIDEAARLSERSVSIWDQAVNERPESYSDALILRGNVLAVSGDLSGARDAYTRSLAIRERIGGRDHPNSVAARVTLAALEAETGQRAMALEDSLAAEDNYSRSSLEALFDSIIQSRAIVFDEIASRRRVLGTAAEPQLSAAWATWISARQRLANLTVRADQSAGQVAIREETQREAERAERLLAEQSAVFRAEHSRPTAGLNAVKAALPKASALVAFVRFKRALSIKSAVLGAKRADNAYVAFVLPADSTRTEIVALGPASPIEDAVAEWRGELGRNTAATLAASGEQRLRAAGARVRQQLWAPVARYLTTAERVFVVPDGAINVVNLAALPVGASEYLIERGPIIHHLTAERDLVRPTVKASAARRLLVMGGAEFDDADTYAVAPQVKQMAVASTRTTCGSFESMQFGALPGTLGEARDIADRWGASAPGARPAVQVLTGKAASERAFKAQAPGQRILHLATHGFFIGRDCDPVTERTRGVGSITTTGGNSVNALGSPLLQTGLALAGANRRQLAKPDEDDGILTAEEVASLNLDGVEWTVLSACDTGLGEIKTGEGVFGLRRAFQIAGARTVIMSLWSVEDKSTREWMRALYDARLDRQLDTAAAVRDAGLTVMRARRAKGQSTHPFYWAAFVAAGDWR